MARAYPSTASQDRMIRLFCLKADDTNDGAGAVLTAASLPYNGIPDGFTPQKAKKLSDDELVAMFPGANTAIDSAEIIATATAERNANAARFIAPTIGDRIRASKERERQNGTLRAAGYRWQRPYSGEGVDRYDADETGWELVASDGRTVTVREALAEIATR